MTDRKTLDKAREWAKRTSNNPDKFWGSRAAAEVIQSLPDEWVDAFFIHDTITQMNQVIEEPVGDDYALGYDAATEAWRHHLRSLLPTPAPRTLADMTPDERKACQWRVVDTPEGEGVYFKQHGDYAAVIYPNGSPIFWVMEEVTPLLDRPRMEWPSSKEEDTTEPEFDPAYTYRDKDGEDWSYVAGGWHWGGYAISRPHSAPPAKCGPYTRIKDTNE